MIHTNKVAELIRSIRAISEVYTDIPKVYVYTSIAAWDRVRTILAYADGIVLTPHSQSDIDKFVELNNMMQEVKETKSDFIKDQGDVGGVLHPDAVAGGHQVDGTHPAGTAGLGAVFVTGVPELFGIRAEPLAVQEAFEKGYITRDEIALCAKRILTMILRMD